MKRKPKRKRQRKDQGHRQRGGGHDDYNKQHIPADIAEQMLDIHVQLEQVPHWQRQPLLDQLAELHQKVRDGIVL